jgi:hypothetical protein
VKISGFILNIADVLAMALITVQSKSLSYKDVLNSDRDIHLLSCQ